MKSAFVFSMLFILLCLNVAIALFRSVSFRFVVPDTECVVLDVEASSVLVSYDRGSRGSPPSVKALHMSMWMAATGDEDALSVPTVGRFDLDVVTQSNDWKDVMPEFAPGSVHTCLRDGTLEGLVRVRGASYDNVGGNKARGSASEEESLWLWFLFALTCMLLVLCFTVFFKMAADDGEMSAESLQAAIGFVLKLMLICLCMIAACVLLEKQRESTCSFVAAAPLGTHGVRMWAATENGAAQFDYVALEDLDRAEMLARAAGKSSVACSVSGFGTHPRELRFQNYAGIPIYLRSSDYDNVAREFVADVVFASTAMLLDGIFVAGLLYIHVVSSEKARYADPRVQ